MKNIVDSYSRNFIDVVCRGEWRIALPLVSADLVCRTRSDGRHGHGCARHDRAASTEGARAKADAGIQDLNLNLNLNLLNISLGMVILRVASKQAN